MSRTCSECGASLAHLHPSARTCSDVCRQKRARRRRNQNFEAEQEASIPSISQLVANEAPDVVTRVMKDELRPLVRDAITEEVMQSIKDLVGLTPKAVNAIKEDLESEDHVLRQRAYTQLIKYTVGHPALVTKPEEQHGDFVVHFNLPRPDGVEVIVEGQEDGVEETRVCDMCGEEKLFPQEFVAESERCSVCFVEWRERVKASFA